MLLREPEIGVRLFQQLRLQLFISFLFCHPFEMNGLLQVLRHQFHSYPTPSPGCAALIGSRVRQSNDRAPLHARNATLACYSSITSVARSKIDRGTARPSALA